ncbi:MAG TPA: acyltransferase [Pseudomonadota bacterium]|nr:acyltransferase [Pseudomonadota bacterium]
MSHEQISPPQPARGRAVVFDALRIFAAIQVVLGHYAFSSHAAGRTGMYSSLLREEARYGYVTVDIFFIISGYFITMTTLKHDWRSFALSRVSRILAPLSVCATLTFIGCRILSAYSNRPMGVLDWLANVTGLILIPGVGQRLQVLDVVYWTLQIEVTYYLIVTIGLAIGLVQLRLMAAFLVACLIAAIAEQFTKGFSVVLFATQWLSRFAVGGTLFILSREPRSRVVWAHFVGAVALMMVSVWQRAIDRVNLEHVVFNPVISCSIMVVATAILTWFSLRPLRRDFSLTQFLGGVSFPLYLIHHQLGCTIANVLKIGDNTAAVLALAAMMLGLACLIHWAAEKPLASLMRRGLDALARPRPGSLKPASVPVTHQGP